MPKYAVFLYTPNDDAPPIPGAREEHERHSVELQASKAMLAAVVLEDATTATSIRGDVISDGPFLESKEVIAGLYVLDAPDLDVALATAGRNPILRQGGGIEVRPIEEFGVWSTQQ